MLGHVLLMMGGKAPPGNQIWTTAGTFTFTVPDGYTSVTVDECLGGGGGGGGNYLANNAGVGGSAGSRVSNTVVSGLTPGQSITVIVGARGTGASGGNGSSGGNSSFHGTVVASGGAGGAYNAYPRPLGGYGGNSIVGTGGAPTAYHGGDGTGNASGGAGASSYYPEYYSGGHGTAGYVKVSWA